MKSVSQGSMSDLANKLDEMNMNEENESENDEKGKKKIAIY